MQSETLREFLHFITDFVEIVGYLLEILGRAPIIE
jgi:hypothetical protein